MAKIREAWKNMNWLRVAGLLTLAYLAFLGWMFGGSKIWTFLTTTNELNSAGDFIAGICGPLALLWLGAAVATQRQELTLTKDQFAENQKVVDAQLKTINSQNALLSVQHDQSVEDSKRAYKLSLFDKRFAIYEKFISFGKEHEHDLRDFDDSSYWGMISLSHEASFVFDQTVAEWFQDIAGQIDEYMQYKALNPLGYGENAFGNEIVLATKQNEGLKTLYSLRRDAIRDQFLHEARIGKFWRYLDVSDQPLIAG
ncbi:hypothetical protein [Ensifer canadensis]